MGAETAQKQLHNSRTSGNSRLDWWAPPGFTKPRNTPNLAFTYHRSKITRKKPKHSFLDSLEPPKFPAAAKHEPAPTRARSGAFTGTLATKPLQDKRQYTPYREYTLGR